MALSPGDKLGPYEILAPLGAEGMGEVYRARDGKLNREVAIKVLPASNWRIRTERSGNTARSSKCPPRASTYSANVLLRGTVCRE